MSSLKAQLTKTPRRLTQLDRSCPGITSDTCSVKASGKRPDFVTSSSEPGCSPTPASAEGHILEWVPGNTFRVSKWVPSGECWRRIRKWGKAKKREPGTTATNSICLCEKLLLSGKVWCIKSSSESEQMPHGCLNKIILLLISLLLLSSPTSSCPLVFCSAA